MPTGGQFSAAVDTGHNIGWVDTPDTGHELPARVSPTTPAPRAHVSILVLRPEVAVLCRQVLWVPNWSSTAVTCDIAGSSSRHYFGPFRRICPCGRFDQCEARARARHLAELITTMITGALTRATEGFTTGASSSHAGSH